MRAEKRVPKATSRPGRSPISRQIRRTTRRFTLRSISSAASRRIRLTRRTPRRRSRTRVALSPTEQGQPLCVPSVSAILVMSWRMPGPEIEGEIAQGSFGQKRRPLIAVPTWSGAGDRWNTRPQRRFPIASWRSAGIGRARRPNCSWWRLDAGTSERHPRKLFTGRVADALGTPESTAA
jgi:hypothetical protein